MGNNAKKYGYVTADETKIATVTNTFRDIGPLNTPLSSFTYNGGSVAQTFATAPYGGKQWLMDTVRGIDGNRGGYIRSTNAGGVFDLGSGNFTVETYFYSRQSSNDQSVISINNGSGFAGLLMYARTASFYTRVSVTNVGVAWDVDSLSSYSINTWNHYAMTRSGNTFRVYINGTKRHEVTTGTAISLKTSCYLLLNGIWPAQGGFSTFYFKDYRMIKGTALYTGESFVPQQMPSYNEYADTVYIPGNNITNRGVAVATNRNKFLNRVRTINTI
jgi:hypothetical protein